MRRIKYSTIKLSLTLTCSFATMHNVLQMLQQQLFNIIPILYYIYIYMLQATRESASLKQELVASTLIAIKFLLEYFVECVF